jgi:hypothetical protein
MFRILKNFYKEVCSLSNYLHVNILFRKVGAREGALGWNQYNAIWKIFAK